MAIFRFLVLGFRLLYRQIPKHPPKNIKGMIIGAKKIVKRTANGRPIFLKVGFPNNFFILFLPLDISMQGHHTTK